jgi:hypothetical protein
MKKGNAIQTINDFLGVKVLNKKNSHYSAVTNGYYFFNIKNEKMNEGVFVICDDEKNKQYHLLKIHSIANAKEIFDQRESGKYKASYLNIKVNDKLFRSKGFSLKKYVLAIIKYSDL